MRFLLCIDDTDFSASAADALRGLADGVGADVHLFHVIIPTAEDRAEPYSGSTREVRQAREREFAEKEPPARRRLETIAESFQGHTEVVVWFHPDPGEAIIEYAEAHDIDLIALATHSREQVPDETHLGATAERVTLSGVAPVWLVHRPGRDEPLAMDAFAPGTPVFTADGLEIGAVAEAADDAFSVKPGEGRTYWLPRRAAAAIQSGRLVLYWDAAMLDRQRAARSPSG